MTQAELEGRDATELLARLRAGDEVAFERLVARHNATMLAVALTHVNGRATAEEVVQETWLGVVGGLDRFEGRSALTTWILSILVHKAKSRGVREARSVPFASLGVAPERSPGRGEAHPGHWREWSASAVSAVQDRETLRLVLGAIAALPPVQRTVIRMRDVEGYAPAEVCAVLRVSEGNQRVLLHRARSRVRAALEAHLAA
jgi:RNA polymerase sigma-70 factor (ECF subfamily)